MTPPAASALVPNRRMARRTEQGRPVRTVAGGLALAARLLGFDALAARRNAWEAVCANRERRRQWEEST